jgi:glycosyltransferase involved in cell wall biosynthesis
VSSTADQLVKVVLTTYNRRSWAEIAIDSVLAQTHPSVHLVIVDDASTDGTAALARGYEEKEPERITAICKPENRGVADSIIRGFRSAPTAPFVGCLNDDDVWLPTKLERQLERFAARPEVGLSYCEALAIDESGAETGELFSDLFGELDHGDQFGDLLRLNRASASTLLLGRDVAELAAATLPQPSYVWDYYLMLVAAGYSALDFLDEPLALYRKSHGIHTEDNRMWRDTTRARQELFAHHPVLRERVGGRAAARRMAALLTVDVAIRKLKEREWREYVWHSGAALRERSPRALYALVLHTVKELRG